MSSLNKFNERLSINTHSLIIIKKAEKEHSNEIVEFQVKMALETEGINLDKLTVQPGVSAVLDDSAKGSYYVTLLNGVVVASLLVTYEWSDWRNGQVFWIQSLYVIPERRKMGIFRKMYSFSKSEVLKNDTVMGIRLYLDKSNKMAIKVYKSLGINDEHYQLFEWIIN